MENKETESNYVGLVEDEAEALVEDETEALVEDEVEAFTAENSGSDFVSQRDREDARNREREHEIKRQEVESTFGTVVSENPIPSAPKPKYGLSESWSRGRDYKKPFDFTLSSGQETKVRRLDMGDLLKLGIAEEMDFMTKALMTSEKKESGGEAVASALMQTGNFENMETMVNKVVLSGLLAPKVHQPPLKEEVGPKGLTLIVDEEAKKENVLYVDDVPFADRMELFSVIFDSDGLTTFRGEQVDGVGDVETIPSVSLPAD